jgi:tRNA-Thr(GGU) m(6)t(6)A37 methyltransferase TsaA
MAATIIFRPIGIIHTPFAEHKDAPIQPRRGKGIKGTIDIFPEYTEGLADLDGFSHIYLIFHLHRSEGFKLRVVPYLDDNERGVFATRAPRRPNAIGLSIVRLDRIEGSTLYIEDVDMLDGTPLLDIKPFVHRFDEPDDIRIGWLEGKAEHVDDTKDDGRSMWNAE